MIQQITEGISISVEVFYQPEQSNPQNADYLFAYRITIENLSTYPIQLLSRRWHIQDSIGTRREVKGEGVVGAQPLLPPSGRYQYVSAVNLESDMGKMSGEYTMENKYNKKSFSVIIPEFDLIAPAKLN